MASWIKNGYETTEDLKLDMANMNIGDMSMMNMNRFSLDDFKKMMLNMKLPDKVGSVTSSEVAKHHTVKDCWLIIESKVYSIPDYWIQMHPGGPDVFPPLCGKDATEPFKAHSTEKPQEVLKYFYIGDLVN